jgi:hypothetical protein
MPRAFRGRDREWSDACGARVRTTAKRKRTLRASVLVALGAGALLMPAAPAVSRSVVSSASGSGAFIATNADTGEQGLRNFQFAAVRYSDGTASGQAQLKNRALDVIVHIEIDCLLVIGNQARMSGVITFIDDPAQGEVGELNRFVVEDNGEGAGAPPDMISTVPVNPELEECEDTPFTLTPNRVVQQGNVQVR